MKRRRFKQLTRADRLNIEKYLRQGMTKQAVADALGVSLRTVYYELKRGQYIHTNSDLTEEVRYSCDVAESVKKYNGTNKGPQLKIGDDHELAAYIERRIVEDGYSPAAVLGEIRVKSLKFKTSICKPTLYSYIRKGVFLTLEMRDLPPSRQEQARLHPHPQEGRQGFRRNQYRRAAGGSERQGDLRPLGNGFRPG